MKFRIVQMDNGKYMFQYKFGWFDDWNVSDGQYDSAEECRKIISYLAKKPYLRNVKEIIEVIKV